jgi:hypothetical protein
MHEVISLKISRQWPAAGKNCHSCTELFNYNMAYRPVAGQRPRNKLRVHPLLCNRWINKRPFLSNGSANTFPRKRTCTQQQKNGVFDVVVQSGYKEENWGNPVSWGLAVQLSSARGLRRDGAIFELEIDKSSARAAATRRPERGKLKNLNC